jgi:hypothetical protein
MKQLFYHIRYISLGIFLVLLTVASATAQKAVPYIEVTQCDTIEFTITEFPGDEYTWDLYQDSSGNFATNQGDMEAAVYFEDGMYRGSTVHVLGLQPGSYFLRIMAWDEVECTNNLMLFKMTVIEALPPEVYGDSLCIGDVPLVKIIFSGTGPWDFEYAYGDGVNTVNLIGHTDDSEIMLPITTPLAVGEYTFWIMEVTDACTVNSYEVDERPSTGILIFPKPTNSKIYLKDD